MNGLVLLYKKKKIKSQSNVPTLIGNIQNTNLQVYALEANISKANNIYKRTAAN